MIGQWALLLALLITKLSPHQSKLCKNFQKWSKRASVPLIKCSCTQQYMTMYKLTILILTYNGILLSEQSLHWLVGSRTKQKQKLTKGRHSKDETLCVVNELPSHLGLININRGLLFQCTEVNIIAAMFTKLGGSKFVPVAIQLQTSLCFDFSKGASASGELHKGLRNWELGASYRGAK